MKFQNDGIDQTLLPTFAWLSFKYLIYFLPGLNIVDEVWILILEFLQEQTISNDYSGQFARELCMKMSPH